MNAREILYNPKFPTSLDNYVGIEIEFLLQSNRRKKLEKLLLAENLHYNVHSGSDGSVTDTTFVPQYRWRQGPYGGYNEIINEGERCYGREIRILATEKDAPQLIDKVCKIIKKCGGKVNDTCGLHVHLDMRQRDVDSVFNNFFFLQKALYSTQPKNRHNNKYCKIIKRKTVNPKDRYYGLNKKSYKEMKTLEIRIHEGTIDPVEIKMWTGLLIKIANIEEKLKKNINFDKLELPKPLQGYLNVRVKKYA